MARNANNKVETIEVSVTATDEKLLMENSDIIDKVTSEVQPEAQLETATEAPKQTATQNPNREIIFFSNFLVSTQSADYFFDHPTVILNKDEKSTKAIVKGEFLNSKERAVFEEFADTFGLQAADNYGMLIYDEDYKLVFYSYPTIGLLNGEACLMLGAQQKNACQSATVKLVNAGNGSYTINGLKAVLTCVKNDLGATPYIVIKSPNYIYYIGLKYDRENVQYEALDAAFDDGQFEHYLTSFFGTRIPGNKMFQQHFINGTFPTEGVLMLLENGRIIKGNINGKETKSSYWQLKAVSPHQALMQVQGKDNSIHTLEDVEGLYLPESCDATKMLLADSSVTRLWLYAKGTHRSNRPNHDWMFDHVAAKEASRLAPKAVAQFGDMIRYVAQLPAAPTPNYPEF